MKVKELIESLSKMDPEAECILQKDEEGNGYSPLQGADPDCIYIAEEKWCGTVYPTEFSAEENGFEEDEWKEILKNHPKCVVLFPI